MRYLCEFSHRDEWGLRPGAESRGSLGVRKEFLVLSFEFLVLSCHRTHRSLPADDADRALSVAPAGALGFLADHVPGA